MKLRIFTLTIFSLLCTLSWGQLLYNSGGTITITTGATLYVEGGVENTATGTIDNNGMMEIKGNFVNAGTWESSDPNTVKFSGNTNSDVTSGGAQFHTIINQKDDTYNVNLMDNMTITNNLDFNSTGGAQIVTGNFDLMLGNSATVTGYDDNEYVATTGTGFVQKGVTANGTFEFPIGDGTNYSPLTSEYTGSAYASANLRARVNDLTHPNKPIKSTDFISRYWDINATGITDYENLLTGTYIPADVTGTAADIKGASYDGSEWYYGDPANGANLVTGSTSDLINDFTGTNFFGKVNIMVFLQAGYSGGVMNTNLPTLGQPTFPLISPYTDAPDTASTIPAGVTDWIKLELRDENTPSIVLGKISAFVKSDGSVVGMDGTSLPQIKNGNPSSIVAVLHRSHLRIRTPAGLDVVNPTLYDFTSALSQAYDNPNILTNDAMVSLGNGDWGMWRGNVNSDLNLNVLDFGLTKTNSNPSQLNVYSVYDVNFDKNVNVLDLGIVKSATNPSKAAHQ